MARLRIVLVEDGTFAHGSLRSALEALDLDVVAEGADWTSLTDQADARSADAFVVVPGEDPHLLYEMEPGHRAAIVITDRLSDTSVAPAIEHGAFAFVPFPPDGPLMHAQLRAALFGPAPALFGHVAEVADGDGRRTLVGCALWFLNFSTWRGVHGLYLEDLYVQPAHRGAGLGRALLARLARDHDLLVTLEEGVLPGGFGSGVMETLSDAGDPSRVLRIGLPDRYVTHGAPKLLHQEVGFTGEAIAERIEAAVLDPHGSLAGA